MMENLDRWMKHSWRALLRRDEILKQIDADVELARANPANTPMGQIARADIVYNTIRWTRKYPRSDRRRAVDDLHDLAEEQIGNVLAPAQRRELEDLIAGRALGRRQVDLKLIYVPPAGPHRIAVDMSAANDIWASANVRFERWPPGTAPQQLALQLGPAGGLGYQAERDLVLEHVPRLRGFVHVCYGPRLEGMGDPAGHTLRRGGGRTDSIIKIGVNLARIGTLAHELGHVLLNEGNHHPNPNNLMAAGAARRDLELTPGQIVLARHSTYCR